MIQLQATLGTDHQVLAVPASTWNQLWDHYGHASPLARDECQQRFARCFARGRLFRLTESRDGEMVAGLTLVKGRIRKVIPAFISPNNPWLQTGCLLVRDRSSADQAMQSLAGQLARLPAPFVVLDWLYETPAVLSLIRHLQGQGMSVRRQPQFSTGIIDIQGDWESYFGSRSPGFRKKMRSGLRKLKQLGEVGFERYAAESGWQDWPELIDAALRIEHLGWKGEQGTSMNSHPTIRRAFLDVLLQLAGGGMLELQFLTVAGQRIAFEIGFRSHRTYFSYKIGFDPEFARCGPGQILTLLQLQHWFAGGQVDQVDTVGQWNAATAKWCTQFRQQYRYIVATRSWGAAAMQLESGFRLLTQRMSANR